MQLEALELNKQQNIMRDINLEDIDAIGVNEDNDLITVRIALMVRQKDYVVDRYTGNVLRGDAGADNLVAYELTFVSKKVDVTTCPNCGAKIEDASSQTCSYCGSTLVGTGTKWALAKKEIIRQ